MKRSTVEGIIIAGLALVIAGVWLTYRHLPQGPAPAGVLKTVTEFRDDKPLPNFSLSGPKGEFTNAGLLGQWSFVFFGYTQCPDICPTALNLMKTVQAQLAATPTGDAVPTGDAISPRLTFQTIFVSVDPQRDTRELMDQYVAAFDPAFIGLRGEDAQLQPLLRDLGVFFQRNDTTDKKNYTVDHSAAIYLIDPKGRLAAVFSPPQQAAAMAADFQRIVTERQ